MPTTRQWEHLAQKIADSTQVCEGSAVSIFLTDPEVMPAVEAFVAEVYRRGGTPQVLLTDERFDYAAVRYDSESNLEVPAPLERQSMEWANAHISFRAMVPPPSVTPDSERLALQRKAKGLISSLRWQKTRWAIVRVPTEAWAAMIGHDYESMLAEFFDGCLADWERLRETWSELCRQLEGKNTIRIEDSDTDLRLEIANRTWVVFAGEANLPDGEIATAPLENGVNGHISFPGRFWFAGKVIENLRLEFVQGKVSKIESETGEEFARALINTDEGSDRVGEVGIGLNPGIRTLTGDLFVDEKVPGTVHIALGRAYPECGGHNASSLHWDLVKDLRAGGDYASGSLVADDLTLINQGVASEHLRPYLPSFSLDQIGEGA